MLAEEIAQGQIQNQEYHTKKFKCELCDYSSASQSTVERHQLVHSDNKPFACSFPGCHFRTKYEKNVKDHEPRHDPLLQTRHKCPICSKGFCMRYQLNRHIRSHTQEKLKKCPECDFKAVNSTGLISHKKKVHGIGKVGKRNQTSKYSGSETNDLKVNFKTALVDGVKLYKCLFPGCEYQTKTKECVPSHHTVHSLLRNFPCKFPDCEMKFKTAAALKGHMKSHDSNRPRNRECPMCSKKFLDWQGLKRHIKSHTGERVYQCPFCDYDSVENCNVYRHIRQHHPDDWIPGTPLTRNTNFGENRMTSTLFQCELCDFVGDSEISLLKHSVIHRRLSVNIRKFKLCSHGLPYTQDCMDCKAETRPMAYSMKLSTPPLLPVVVLERLSIKV